MCVFNEVNFQLTVRVEKGFEKQVLQLAETKRRPSICLALHVTSQMTHGNQRCRELHLSGFKGLVTK